MTTKTSHINQTTHDSPYRKHQHIGSRCPPATREARHLAHSTHSICSTTRHQETTQRTMPQTNHAQVAIGNVTGVPQHCSTTAVEAEHIRAAAGSYSQPCLGSLSIIATRQHSHNTVAGAGKTDWARRNGHATAALSTMCQRLHRTSVPMAV